MSDTKFTKGVWVCCPKSPDGAVILCGDDVNLCSGKDIIFMNEKVHDAHLIAAAPEMYAILELSLTQLNLKQFDLYKDIEKLLEKARGE